MLLFPSVRISPVTRHPSKRPPCMRGENGSAPCIWETNMDRLDSNFLTDLQREALHASAVLLIHGMLM